MSSKSTTNPVKVLKANPGMMAATLVVGAALATAGWWLSDRLILPTVAATPTINEVGDCKDGIDVQVTDESGRIFTQRLNCGLAKGRHLRWVKTASGSYYMEAYGTSSLATGTYYTLGTKVDTGNINAEIRRQYLKDHPATSTYVDKNDDGQVVKTQKPPSIPKTGGRQNVIE